MQKYAGIKLAGSVANRQNMPNRTKLREERCQNSVDWRSRAHTPHVENGWKGRCSNPTIQIGITYPTIQIGITVPIQRSRSNPGGAGCAKSLTPPQRIDSAKIPIGGWGWLATKPAGAGRQQYPLIM